MIQLRKIRKSVHNQSACFNYPPLHSRMYCLTKKYADKLIQSNKDICLIPQVIPIPVYYFHYFSMIFLQLESVLRWSGNSGIPTCGSQSLYEYQTMVYKALDALSTYEKAACLPECEQITYAATHRNILMADNRKEVTVSLAFASMEVEVQEEVLIFDFNAILSAVGGSLGLFIGFSFLDFLSYIFEFIMVRCLPSNGIKLPVQIQNTMY